MPITEPSAVAPDGGVPLVFESVRFDKCPGLHAASGATALGSVIALLDTFPRLSVTILSSMQTASAQLISEELLERFRKATNVLVLTGAGVSAESGVPTFRGGGKSAVWKGMPFDVMSSASMVQRDLPAVWEWFDYRRNLLAALKPNAAHFQIAEWQNQFERCTVVTQNVDGLHQKAGARNVVELHGSIWRARCLSCNARYDIQDGRPRAELCVACGDRLRPDVVLFGEILPPRV